MAAKIKYANVIFIKPRKVDTADIKCFTVSRKTLNYQTSDVQAFLKIRRDLVGNPANCISLTILEARFLLFKMVFKDAKSLLYCSVYVNTVRLSD